MQYNHLYQVSFKKESGTWFLNNIALLILARVPIEAPGSGKTDCPATDGEFVGPKEIPPTLYMIIEILEESCP